MNPEEQLAAEAAAFAANDKPLLPHPAGLVGRCQDALDDAELLDNDPTASPQAKQTAQQFAAALTAALAAEG